MAESLQQYFSDERNLRVIRGLLAAGVRPEEVQLKRTDKLTGKTIVITGTLAGLTRRQAQEAVKAAGGKTSSSVSSKTNFVLAGTEPGSKLDKAHKLGVNVINEQQFLEMLE